MLKEVKAAAALNKGVVGTDGSTPDSTPRTGFGGVYGGGGGGISIDLASLGSFGGSMYSAATAGGLLDSGRRASTVDQLIESLQGGGLADSTKMSGRKSIRDKITGLAAEVDLPVIFGANVNDKAIKRRAN